MNKYIGYLCVSTDTQGVESQKHSLMQYALARGFTPITWVENKSNNEANWRKTRIGELIDSGSPGDTLLVTEVSGLSRSTLGALEIIHAALAAGINIHVTRKNLVADDSERGRTIITALELAAQIERELMDARARGALAKRLASGVVLGRPTGQAKNLKLDPRREEILEMMRKKVSKRSIARIFDVPPSTLYRWLERNKTPGTGS